MQGTKQGNNKWDQMTSVDIKIKNIYISLENLGCIERDNKVKQRILPSPFPKGNFFFSFLSRKKQMYMRLYYFDYFFVCCTKGIMKYILFCALLFYVNIPYFFCFNTFRSASLIFDGFVVLQRYTVYYNLFT